RQIHAAIPTAAVASAKAGTEPRGLRRIPSSKRALQERSVCSENAGSQLPRELTQPASPRVLTQRGKGCSAGFRPRERALDLAR
ncbi:hypothetical protein M9458_051432, partial [Cirrhinus mrigala]